MQEISIRDPTITLRFREIFRYHKIVSETTQETLPTKNMLTALNFLNTCGNRKMKKIYIYVYVNITKYMLYINIYIYYIYVYILCIYIYIYIYILYLRII